MRKILKLRDISTFKIGEKKIFLFLPKNVGELINYINKYKSNNYFFFGHGSNVLFDENIDKVIISSSFMNKLNYEKNDLIVGAGIHSSFLAVLSFILNIEGYDFLHLLPGSIGGAVYMNARCYESEISNINLEIESIEIRKNNQKYEIFFKKRLTKDCNFSYKKSIFQNNGELIFRVRFKDFFKDDNQKKIFELIKDDLNIYFIKKISGFPKLTNLKKFYKVYKLKRILKLVDKEIKKKKIENCQNLKIFIDKRAKIYENLSKIENDRVLKKHFKYKSCGSVFKNNYSFGVPIGKLVDDLGLKGYKINGVSVSPFHGNIIINYKNGRIEDYIKLKEFIKEKIRDKYGFIPEEEVIIVK
jgi:UDP-N-acetylmuramate dehydrogenase